MTTLKVTAKGQVTLRKELLAHLGVGAGDKVAVDVMPNGRIQIRAARHGHISDVFGMLKREGGPVFTIEEINGAIADGWAGIGREDNG